MSQASFDDLRGRLKDRRSEQDRRLLDWDQHVMMPTRGDRSAPRTGDDRISHTKFTDPEIDRRSLDGASHEYDSSRRA
jgi:hypothetical protein